MDQTIPVTADLEVASYVIAPRPIADRLGLFAAVVYGAVWGFCHMARGQCDASAATIAKQACVSVTTARKELDRLVKEGYLALEPGPVAWKPNVYRLTNRLTLRTRVSLVWDDQPSGMYRDTIGGISQDDRESIAGRYQKEKSKRNRKPSASALSEQDQGNKPNERRGGQGRVTSDGRVKL